MPILRPKRPLPRWKRWVSRAETDGARTQARFADADAGAGAGADAGADADAGAGADADAGADAGAEFTRDHSQEPRDTQTPDSLSARPSECAGVLARLNPASLRYAPPSEISRDNCGELPRVLRSMFKRVGAHTGALGSSGIGMLSGRRARRVLVSMWLWHSGT
jgi:hypothetical protein